MPGLPVAGVGATNSRSTASPADQLSPERFQRRWSLPLVSAPSKGNGAPSTSSSSRSPAVVRLRSTWKRSSPLDWTPHDVDRVGGQVVSELVHAQGRRGRALPAARLGVRAAEAPGETLDGQGGAPDALARPPRLPHHARVFARERLLRAGPVGEAHLDLDRLADIARLRGVLVGIRADGGLAPPVHPHPLEGIAVREGRRRQVVVVPPCCPPSPSASAPPPACP